MSPPAGDPPAESTIDWGRLQELTTQHAEHPVTETIRPPPETFFSTIGVELSDSADLTGDGVSGLSEPEQGERRRELAEDALQIGASIGEGGMGVVHLARQHCLSRDVAIKRVRPDRRSGYAALRREGEIMGSLEHPGVIPVYALLQDRRGHPVLVMKRVEGVPWSALIADPDHPGWTPLDLDGPRLRQHIEILMKVCQSVHFAHTRGVVHRDLKPDNVMVGAHGEVYVLDWGIATRLGERPVPVAVCGTPSYMAPEMLRPETPISATLDVYLLGACLYDVLEGHPPHQGGSLAEVLQRIVQDEPLAFGPQTPAPLADICRRAMASEPSQRHASAQELRRALQRYLHHLGAIALADAAGRRLEEAAGMLESVERRRRGGELLAEARFGFAQALKAWPGCESALKGERRALRLTARAALESRDLEGCAAALTRLAALGEADTEGIGEQLEAARREADRIRALAQARDLSVSSRQRQATLGVAGVLGLLFSSFIILYTERNEVQLSRVDLLRFAVVTVATILALVGLARRWLVKNAINRQIAGLVILGGVGLLLNRLIGVVMERAIMPILVVDMMVFTILAAASAITYAPWLVWTALALLVSTGVGMVWSGPPAIWFGGSVITSIGIGVTSWWYQGSAARRGSR